MHPLLKSGLGLLFTIQEDGADKKPASTPEKQTNNNNASTNSFSNTSNSQNSFQSNDFSNYNTPVNASIDTGKFRQYFLDLMKKINFPGNDYYELNVSLEAMTQVIPDERTRFIAAFTPLKINGLTLQQINDSANAYVSALDDDAQKFNAAIEQNKKDNLGSQKKKIEDNNLKIQELTAQIQQLNQESNTIGAQIAQDEQQINASKTGYDIEYKNLRTKILNDLNKANQYLQ